MKIDKNVPISKLKVGRPSGSSKYAEMKLGDSIFYDSVKAAHIGNVAVRQFLARNHPNLTTSTRKEGEGARIWIIEKTQK